MPRWWKSEPNASSLLGDPAREWLIFTWFNSDHKEHEKRTMTALTTLGCCRGFLLRYMGHGHGHGHGHALTSDAWTCISSFACGVTAIF